MEEGVEAGEVGSTPSEGEYTSGEEAGDDDGCIEDDGADGSEGKWWEGSAGGGGAWRSIGFDGAGVLGRRA